MTMILLTLTILIIMIIIGHLEVCAALLQGKADPQLVARDRHRDRLTDIPASDTKRHSFECVCLRSTLLYKQWHRNRYLRSPIQPGIETKPG